MQQSTNVSIKAEIFRKVVGALPVRRSQVSNWLLKLFGPQKPFVGTFMGQKLEIHPSDAASRSAYFLGFYERETTIWLFEYLKKNKPKTVIDIGANFGYFSFLNVANNPGCQVHAFEPDPYNYQWLNRNTKLNQLNGAVKVHQLAISNSKGKVSFIPSSPDEGKTLWAQMNLGSEKTSKEIEVNSTTLDAFCAEKAIEQVDLLKIDIEGAEGYAVEGMSEGIKSHKYKVVLIELHPHMLPQQHSAKTIVEAFIKNGYSAYQFVPSYKETANDKHAHFYDLSWKQDYVKKVDISSLLTEWEHVLFLAPGYSVT